MGLSFRPPPPGYEPLPGPSPDEDRGRKPAPPGGNPLPPPEPAARGWDAMAAVAAIHQEELRTKCVRRCGANSQRRAGRGARALSQRGGQDMRGRAVLARGRAHAGLGDGGTKTCSQDSRGAGQPSPLPPDRLRLHALLWPAGALPRGPPGLHSVLARRPGLTWKPCRWAGPLPAGDSRSGPQFGNVNFITNVSWVRRHHPDHVK